VLWKERKRGEAEKWAKQISPTSPLHCGKCSGWIASGLNEGSLSFGLFWRMLTIAGRVWPNFKK
jgi:hypothetical protein